MGNPKRLEEPVRLNIKYSLNLLIVVIIEKVWKGKKIWRLIQTIRWTITLTIRKIRNFTIKKKECSETLQRYDTEIVVTRRRHRLDDNYRRMKPKNL